MNRLIEALEAYGRRMLENDLERKERGKGAKARRQAINDLLEINQMGEDAPALLRPALGVAKGLMSVGPAYDAAIATGVDSLQGNLERFGLSRRSSDRLGRDLLAAGIEMPIDAMLVPAAGVIDKAAEFGGMVKRSRPYLLGEKLETNPDVMNLPEAGRPAAVAIPDSGRFSSRPIAEVSRSADEYTDRIGLLSPRFLEYPVMDVDRARLVAAAYDQMKHDPTNPEVLRAYNAMIDETMDQYRELEKLGIDFKFLRDGMDDPYARSPAMGYQDVVENKQLYVFPTDFGYGSGDFDASDNPLLRYVGRIGDKDDAVANDAFRVVHDMYGHLGQGNPQFRSRGEERAWLEHSRMYGPEARRAMTSETRGQNSWLNFGPYADHNATALGADTVFADQKAGLMPDWTVDPEGLPEGAELRRLRQILKDWGYE